jgi:hypothetical protein
MKNLQKIAMTAILFLMASCQKVAEQLSLSTKKTSNYTTYTIAKGQHECTPRPFKAVDEASINFIVKFNQSAVYTSQIAENQWDVNKLWGFSDGWNHTINSARIGWSWRDGALRLHAFAHVNGQFVEQEITTVELGKDINCSIRIVGGYYMFNVNGVNVNIARATTGTTSRGYQLYPYFGGNETAPHDITIQIKTIN